jgi:hypothetical protein
MAAIRPNILVAPLREAAALLGYDDTTKGRRAAESALRHAGIRSGYPVAAVEWLRDNRPGQGARTDRREKTMPTTTLARYGDLDGRTQADGWTAYIRDGGYNDGQTATLVEALLSAQRDEVDDRLPDGCTWQPATSEIIGPTGTDLGEREDLDEVFASACQAVIVRFDEIESAALGGS